MGTSETLSIVLGAALLMTVALGTLMKFLLGQIKSFGQNSSSTELASLRDENLKLERKAAVEGVLSGRLPELEFALAKARDALDQSRAEKSLADQVISGIKASLNAVNDKNQDLARKIQEESSRYDEVFNRLSKIIEEKHNAEELLSTKIEALRGSEEKNLNLQERLSRLNEVYISAVADIRLLSANNAALKEAAEQQSEKSAEKIELLTQIRGELSGQFKDVAEKIVLQHSENFSKANREQIDVILAPLREKLADFDQKVQISHLETAKDRAALAEQIRSVANASITMNRETKELTEALRGRSQAQGAWGEMVLGTVLEQSGLRSGEEFSTQQTFKNEEGARLRPDVIVNMPGAQKMVIDAKVSLTAFERLVNSSEEEQRGINLQHHLSSIRGHISTLGSKEYHIATGTTVNYVIMFIPIEGALATALRADPSLVAFAAERNVTLSTPTTLIMALKTIASVWQVERRNQNAEEIASRAGKLYEKFVGFLDDMNAVDASLTKSRISYDKAMNKLKQGNGNIIRQIEQLKTMGARTPKAIASSLVDASDELMTVSIRSRTIETETEVDVRSMSITSEDGALDS